MAEYSFSDSDQRGITHFDPNLVESEMSDKARVRVVNPKQEPEQHDIGNAYSYVTELFTSCNQLLS